MTAHLHPPGTGRRGTVCLVCSSGGHFAELHRLRSAWSAFSTVWVTLDSCDTRQLLDGEHVVYAHGPTNRSVPNLLRNAALAWRVLKAHRPVAVVSTGAGVAVPFMLTARILGIPAIYIESLARVRSLSLSGRLSYRLASTFLVQWPELAARYPRARYEGRVL